MERSLVLRPLLLASSPPLRPVLRCSVIRTPRTCGTLWFKRHSRRVCKQFYIIGEQRRKDLIHNKKRSIVRERDKSNFLILTRKLRQQFQEKQHIIFGNTQHNRNSRKGYILCFKTSDIVFHSIDRNGSGFRFKKDKPGDDKAVFCLQKYFHEHHKGNFFPFEEHRLQQTGNLCKQLIFFKLFKQKYKLQQTIHEQFFKKYSHLQPSFFKLQKFFFKFLKQQLVLFKQLQQEHTVFLKQLPQQFFLIRKLPQFRLVLQRRQPLIRQQFIVLQQKALRRTSYNQTE